eukprot:UN23391
MSARTISHFFYIILNQHLDEIDHAIKHLDDWAKWELRDTPGYLAPARHYVQYQPLGIIGVFGCCNVPVGVSIGVMPGIIAAGNGCILKPSEIASRSEKVIASVVNDFLDPDYFMAITGGVDVAKEMSCAKFDKIVFTGGTSIGKIINTTASKNLVPCLLEMGGINPAIVSKT